MNTRLKKKFEQRGWNAKHGVRKKHKKLLKAMGLWSPNCWSQQDNDWKWTMKVRWKDERGNSRL